MLDLGKFDVDPLDLIVKNSRLVKHLRVNGINGFFIKEILDEWLGLRLEIPIAATSEEIEKNRRIDYLLRHIAALGRDDRITDEERAFLGKMYRRLNGEYVPLEKGKSGRAVKTIKVGKGDVKSYKQLVGRQIVALTEYIQHFISNRAAFRKNDVYDLIAELFEARQGQKYTRSQIATFYKNNRSG